MSVEATQGVNSVNNIANAPKPSARSPACCRAPDSKRPRNQRRLRAVTHTEVQEPMQQPLPTANNTVYLARCLCEKLQHARDGKRVHAKKHCAPARMPTPASTGKPRRTGPTRLHRGTSARRRTHCCRAADTLRLARKSTAHRATPHRRRSCRYCKRGHALALIGVAVRLLVLYLDI